MAAVHSPSICALRLPPVFVGLRGFIDFAPVIAMTADQLSCLGRRKIVHFNDMPDLGIFAFQRPAATRSRCATVWRRVYPLLRIILPFAWPRLTKLPAEQWTVGSESHPGQFQSLANGRDALGPQNSPAAFKVAYRRFADVGLRAESHLGPSQECPRCTAFFR